MAIPRRCIGLWAALILGCGSATSSPASGGLVFGPAEPWSLPVEMPRFERSVDGFVVGSSSRLLEVNDARIGWKWLDSGEHALSVGVASIDGSGLASAFSLNGDGRSLSRKVGDGVETIEPHARGVEARWRFERRPKSQGDLVVRWPVGADVSSVVRIDSGVKVEVKSGDSRVATDGVWIDARGTRWPVVVRVEAGAFVWRVGSEVLENTAFPAVLDPIVGPGVELAPFVAGLPAPISNPRVASNGGKALVVWVDRPFVMTSEPATSPVGAFVNVYRPGPVRLKGRLIATPQELATAPLIDIGTGPALPGGVSIDGYDDTFRVLPNGTGFAVFWWNDTTERAGLLHGARVSATGEVLSSGAIDVTTQAWGPTFITISTFARKWAVVVNEGELTLLAQTSSGRRYALRLTESLVPNGVTVFEPSDAPFVNRYWGTTTVGGRGAVLGETSASSGADPYRRLVLYLLPTASRPLETVELARPVSADSPQRVCNYVNYIDICVWAGSDPAHRPPSIASNDPFVFIDDGDAIFRIDASNPSASPLSVPGQEVMPKSGQSSAPLSSTLCEGGGRLLRAYQNDFAYDTAGPRGLQVRTMDQDMVSSSARPALGNRMRFGPSPCGVLSSGPFVVTRELALHAFGHGFAQPSTSLTNVNVEAKTRHSIALGQRGGRHGLLQLVRSGEFDGRAAPRHEFTRHDLLGRRLDATPIDVTGGPGGWPTYSVDSSEAYWFICSITTSHGGQTSVRLRRLNTRGLPGLREREIGRLDIISNPTCLVNVITDRVQVVWRGRSGGPSMLRQQSFSLALEPLGPVRELAPSEGVVPFNDLSVPGGAGALYFLSPPPGDPTAVVYSDESTFRTASVEPPLFAIGRPGGWAGLRYDSTVGWTLRLGSGATGETVTTSTLTPAPPSGGFGAVAWDGVGLVAASWDELALVRTTPSGARYEAFATYPERSTVTVEGQGIYANSANLPSGLASTWGGVGLIGLRKYWGPYALNEVFSYAFHRTAAVTADHLERTLTQNAAHALTLGPTTHTDGTAQGFEIHVPPLHGTATLEGNIATYRSNPEYTGEDSFFFTATGADGSKRAFTVLLDVTDVNDPPVGSAQTIDVNEDETAEFDTTATDPEGETTTIRISTPPAHGTLVRVAGSRFAYAPDSDFNGDDTATLVASDGTQDSEPFSIRFFVAPVNDPPVLESGSTSGDEDTTLSITLAGTDVDGDTLTYTLQTAPTLGLTTITGNQLRFVPAANFNGPVSAVVRATDPSGVESGDATFTFDVQPVNDAPVVQDDAFSIDEDTPFDAPPLVTDVDDATSTLGIEVTGAAPVLGAVSIVGRQLRYSPNTNAHGTDTFRFRMRDAHGGVSGVAIRTVMIRPLNDAPDALDGSGAVVAGGPIDLRIQASDVDGDALTFELVTPPANGTAIPTATGFTYECDPSASTPDAFTFRARDPGGLGSPVRTFQLSRRAAQRAPVVLPIEVTGTEDSPVTITLLGTDADGDPLTYERANSVEHGTVTIDGALATFTPDADWNGTTTFRYQAFDGALRSVPALVTVRIASQNDVPVAAAQSLTLDEDATLDLTLVAQDVDAASLTFTIDTPPALGTLTGTPPNLTFTPPADFHGEVTFTFTASDATTTSEPATVTLSVQPVADTPIALDRTGTGLEDTALRIEFAATDADGDALTFAIDTPPDHGTLVLDPTGATFTPDRDWSGPTSFTYTAFDGTLRSAPAPVTLTITPVNDPPIAPDTRVTLDEDRSAAFTLVGRDPEAASLTWSITRSPTRGTLEAHGSGAFTYVPDPDSNGLDHATFVAHDGELDSAPVNVVFLVQAVNDAPVLPDVQRTQPQGPVAITLVSSDIDGPDANWKLVLAPTDGTLTGELPEVTWTPPDGFVGDVFFVASVSDGSASDEATVRITIVNAPPELTIRADAQEVEEGTPLHFTAIATDPGHDALQLTWGFGDGATATGPEVTHAFVNEGTYTVACTAEDGHVSVTRTIEVVVRNAAPMLLGIDSPAEVNEAARVVFVATANDPGSADDLLITWSFGDGASGQGGSVTHTFADNGTFDVVATVRDPSGSASTRSRTVLVRNVPPVASALSTLDDAPIDVPIEIALQATDVAGAADPLSWRAVSGPGTVDGDVWRFVPGPSDVGRHEVTLEVSDGDEGVDSVSLVVNVAAPVETNDGGSDTPEVPAGCGCGASNALGLLVGLPLLRRRRRARSLLRSTG